MGNLEHFGVKGMKWGIRRPIGKNGLIVTNPKNLSVDDYLKKDQDIKSKTERLRLENNVHRLKSNARGSERKLTRNVKNLSNEDLKKLSSVLQDRDTYNKELKTNKKNNRSLYGKTYDAVKNVSMNTLINVIKKDDPKTALNKGIKQEIKKSIENKFGDDSNTSRVAKAVVDSVYQTGGKKKNDTKGQNGKTKSNKKDSKTKEPKATVIDKDKPKDTTEKSKTTIFDSTDFTVVNDTPAYKTPMSIVYDPKKLLNKGD